MNALHARGFTLLELIVIVVIFGILTALLTRAFPLIREKQRLTLGEQEVQSLVREAQRRALNEERDEGCLTGQADRIPCSDIGLYFNNNQVTLFADTANPNVLGAGDFTIRVATLPAGAQVATPLTLVFRAVPPNISLWANGNEATTTQVLLTTGKFSSTLEVSKYGLTEKK